MKKGQIVKIDGIDYKVLINAYKESDDKESTIAVSLYDYNKWLEDFDYHSGDSCIDKAKLMKITIRQPSKADEQAKMMCKQYMKLFKI